MTKFRLIRSGISGALFGGPMGAMVYAFLNCVGILQSQEWVSVFMAAGAVVGCLNELRENQCEDLKRKTHAEESIQVADQLGLTYSPDVAYAASHGMPLFEHWAKGRHGMSGEKDGVAVEMFDFTAIENTGDGCRTKHLTAVVLPATGLPPFDLRPRAIEYRLLGLVGIQGITFDPAGAPNPSDVATIEQFERLFFLTKHGSLVSPEDTGAECLEQERLIRRLFTPELMWALSQYPTRSVQSHYGWLALWAGDDHQPASARPEMLVDAMTIRAALLTAKDDTTTKAIVPSRRGGDPRQQAGRAASAVLGGFAGLFAGFVMFVLVVTSKFIILPPWLTAMSFFLSLAFGTVAGAYFGGVAANYIVERYKTTCQRKAETATDVGPSTVPNSPGQPRHDVIGPALRMVFGLWFTLGGLVFGGIGAWLRYDMCAEGTSVSPDAARWVVPLMFGGAGLLLGGIGLLTIVRLAWPGQHQPRKAESENTHDSN